LRYLVYRDALFPTHAYLRAWHTLDGAREARQACRDMVALLDIAATGNCVDALGLQIWTCNGFVPVTYFTMPPWPRMRAG
jgi:hypothetical protein